MNMEDLRNIMFPKIDNDYLKNLTKYFEELIIYYTEKNSDFCSKHNVYYNFLLSVSSFYTYFNKNINNIILSLHNFKNMV